MQVQDQNQVTIVTVILEDCSGMLKAIEPMIARDKLRFVFDMTQANYLNSVNIAAIIATRNRIVAAGGKVAISNLSENVRAIFRILKLERMFDLTLDLEQAINRVR
jgi:anti-anti-sigma factor